MLSRRLALIAILLVATFINLVPSASADDYDAPHCDPTAGDYNSQMCSELPQNDPSCTPYGDQSECISDWLDYQNQQHQLYTTTPN